MRRPAAALQIRRPGNRIAALLHSGSVRELGVRRWVDAAAVPWRNGGGLTRELASSPAGDDAFDWRISLADVTAAGAFSAFPDVDRTIVLVDGRGMTLTVDGTHHVLAPHAPFRFDGGPPVSCQLPAGPTRALNVMTRRGRCRAEIVVVDAAAAWPVSDAGVQLVVPLTRPVTVTAAGGRALTLDRFDLVRAAAGSALAVTGDGPVARIQIGPDADSDA